jgi:hypothetical protein
MIMPGVVVSVMSAGYVSPVVVACATIAHSTVMAFRGRASIVVSTHLSKRDWSGVEAENERKQNS